jgi:hypothetical protein
VTTEPAGERRRWLTGSASPLVVAPLAGAAVAILIAFFWLRSRSTFLRIEAERPAAATLAGRHGLTLAEVFALRDLVGADAPPAAWERAAAAFPGLQRELGVPLAAVALAGGEIWARNQRAGDADAEAAWQRARVAPEALPGLRFLALRDRFAARRQARD